MNNTNVKKEQRVQRHKRVRAKVKGTADRPRLTVFRSNKYMYVQLINDETGSTVVSSDTRTLGVKENKAQALGADMASKAKAAGISKIVFDRSGYRFTGQVAVLADALRANGLEF